MVYTLNSLSNDGKLPRIPVFVDSPLAISATQVAREHSQLFRDVVRAELEMIADYSPSQELNSCGRLTTNN